MNSLDGIFFNRDTTMKINTGKPSLHNIPNIQKPSGTTHQGF
jgi:hypothetical protein